MNYLIVVPRIVSNIGDYYMFPTGIAYISAALIESGFKIFKLNLNHIDLPIEIAITNVIIDKKIDVMLTGGLTGQYGAIRGIIEASKKQKNDIITIVGGGIITSSPIYAMQALEFVDYGVIGEGEIIACKLCEALEKGEPVTTVSGLVYKNNFEYTLTEGRAEIVNVDNIPSPDYKDFGIEELLKSAPNIIGISDENTFPIVTSRGCPFHCTFCFHSSGHIYRQRNLDRVFDEMDYLIKNYNIKFFSIQDELFGVNFERIKEFCNRIIHYNVRWFAQFRVTDITEDLVAMLKHANCSTIGFGIESADNRILKSMNKKITIEDTTRALEIVYKAGIGIQGCLIFGDTAETKETVQNSLDWWVAHIHYGLQLSVVGTYPGTLLFKHAIEKGFIADPVQFIRDTCPTVKLSGMSGKEYAWMLEKILSMQRIPQSLPKDISSIHIDYNQKNMDVVGRCRSCESTNYWHKIKLFVAESLTCTECGRRHYAPIPNEIVGRISSNLNYLANKYGTICFWGINSFFYGVCEKMIIDKFHFRCVDKSEIRYGLDVHGIEVQPTDIIKTQNIKCVIVTVPQYFSNIAPAIRREFPFVDEIININTLITSSIESRK